MQDEVLYTVNLTPGNIFNIPEPNGEDFDFPGNKKDAKVDKGFTDIP